MNADTFLQKYVDIETRCFIRSDRNLQHVKLLENAILENSLGSFEEVRYVLDYLNDRQIKIRQPLFSKIIYPVLSQAVDQGNVDAIKLMIKLLNVLAGFQKLTNDHKYSYQ